MNTRSDMRKNKRNKHFILNTLIGIVFILILVVGGNILFGGSDTAEDEQGSAPNEGGSNGDDEDVEITENEDADQNESGNSGEGSNSEQEENDNEQSGNNDENNSDSENDGQEDNDSQQEEQDENGVNSDQIGEPIGTSQTGEHTSSYEEGSVDWNEKVKAIQMATGVGEGMTLWRLESGGGPQQSVGKVSPEGVQDWMYVVDLQWVDQQGWKVTNVDRQNR
ncbi:Protein of unknown function [Lentibacillus persicus]|uniref:DUF1510 domain-containing protein n=1 Tax=Lentibacillus persicus TaxID=640948 RepID=A0A1I1SAI0_9BACI|nr:YrrS family protein [Lentibacillus persicus]SFD40863.1 Protein of unknown function [Lentibacillus persicus]